MAHGTPDWNQTAGTATTYRLSDLAELAARLGSIVAHDRRGDVIFLEDFAQGPARWFFATSGSGALAVLSTAQTRQGQFSVHLLAGSTSGQYARMSHRHALPSTARLGFEHSIHFTSYILYWYLDLYLYAADAWNRYSLRYAPIDSTLQVLDSTGAYVTIATDVVLSTSSTLFYAMKLVIDPTLGQYIRAIVNNREFDLTPYTAVASPLSSPDSVLVVLTCQDQLGLMGDVYVDDVILTINEPAQP